VRQVALEAVAAETVGYPCDEFEPRHQDAHMPVFLPIRAALESTRRLPELPLYPSFSTINVLRDAVAEDGQPPLTMYVEK
jgi:hypothetical protein